MRHDQTITISKGREADPTLLVKEAVGDISSRVRQKYSLIKPETIPDKVTYAKVEKYLRSVNVEITRKMFASYLKGKLIPNDHHVKNSRYSLYTHDQIIYYLLVDMFKSILPLAKTKVLIHDVLRPMISIIGLDDTYTRLCENIASKTDSFENTVALAVEDDIQTGLHHEIENAADAVIQAIGSIAYYTQIETLCLAKGALDYFEQTPNNPLT